MEYLFVYGTLAPGKPNQHVLKDLTGEWFYASVRGTLYQSGWGASMGFPGIVLNPDGPEVKGLIFASTQLSGFWPQLDAFEGDGYQRVLVSATLENGETVQANIYEVNVPDA